MGVAIAHALGRNQRFYAKAESTFGTLIKPTATDALKVLKSTMKFEQARDDRMDSRQTASVIERISGKKTVSWAFESYVVPSGAAGTKPNVGAVLKALCGVETINGGVSVVYTLSASQSARGSLSVVREWNSVAMQASVGAYPHTLGLKINGGDQPKLSIDGTAADLYGTGYTQTAGALSGGETSVAVADATVLEIGSVVQIGTSNGAGAGHLISNIVGSTITFAPGITGAQSNPCDIIPFVPTETTVGSPIAGIIGGFTIDAVTVPITGLEINVKTNDAPVDDEAFTSIVTDYIPGFREVTGTVGIRVRRDLFKYIQASKSFTTRALVGTCGSVAGKRLVINVPFAEFKAIPDVDSPEDKVVVAQIPFKALGSSGEDETSFTFN